MSTLKKIVVVLGSLLVLILLINFGLNFWLNKQLPKIIADSNRTPYAITCRV